jgi:oxygen-independent coproporphyrinogen-3 oxidase
MLKSATPEAEAVRFATADVLEKYVAGSPAQKTAVSTANAMEERFFLGLRLNRGVDLSEVAADFGRSALDNLFAAINQLIGDGLLQRDGVRISLTPRGRLLSNEAFESFLAPGVTTLP